jgi:DHA1 family bicyclomycin/chloramphenicol resistance-like MFS transporter
MGDATQLRGVRLFVVLGSVTVLGPASMDIYLPGLPALARDLGASPSRAQLTVTTFLIGMALGQLSAGPLSDVYGRRQPLVAGMALFSIASLACAAAPNIYVLGATRLVQGVAGASGLAIGRAVVRDLYAGRAAARYLSRLMLITGLGPIVAPVAGGQILRFTDWRGVFVAIALLGIVLVMTTTRWLPETLPRDRRRLAGLAETGRAFRSLLTDRGFVGVALIIGFGGGAAIGYLAGSSFVLEDIYGASPQLYSVLFGMNAVFLVLGAQVNAHLLRRHSPRRLLGVGLAMMVAAGVALLAVVPFRSAGLLSVVPPLTLLMFSWSFVQSNAIAIGLTNYPQIAGSASALLGVSQFSFGAVMAPLVGIAGENTAVPMAIVILACAVGGLIGLKALVRIAGTSAVTPVPVEVPSLP